MQRHGSLNDKDVVPESEVGQVPGARLTVDEREEIALGLAQKAIDSLVDQGILTEVTDRKRNRVYLSPRIMDAPYA